MFDRTWTVGLQNSFAPAVRTIHITLPDLPGAQYEIQACRAGFAGGGQAAPVAILEGDLTLAQAQDMAVASPGPIDADVLLAVPSGGLSLCRPFDRDIRAITVCYTANAGGATTTDYVQIRIRQVR